MDATLSLRARSELTPTLDRLLILLGYLGRNADEDRWIREQIHKVEDWEIFAYLVDDNRVAPRVVGELDRLGLLGSVPDDVRADLDKQATEVAAANRTRLELAAPVLDALREAGIDVAVVKGAAFGVTMYDDPGYKRMNDVDIFVKRDDVLAIRQIYLDHGFFAVGERVGGDEDKQLELTDHLPLYVNRDLTCVLGTDWDFRSPLLRHDFDLDAVWARTRPLTVAGVDVCTLGPEDTLHYVCLHLERFRTGVRDIMDIYNWIHATAGELDWALFEELVERAGTQDDVVYALTFAQAHRPTPEVARTLVHLAPTCRRFVRRLAGWRSRSDRVLVRVCSRQFRTIEKEVAAFNATNVLREKAPLFVSGWASIVWPPTEDALKIAAVVDPSRRDVARARVLASWRLMQAIAEEIGAHLLLGLAVKSVVDLGVAAVPVGRKRDLATYAKDLGVEPHEFRAAQENIQ